VARESLATRLYRGEVSIDFIKRRRLWYGISGGMVLLSIILILFGPGLHASIDFKGGNVFQFAKNGHSQADVRETFSSVGVETEIVQTLGTGDFRVETAELSQTSTNNQVNEVEQAIQEQLGVNVDDIAVQSVGSTWGDQITKKAITGLIIFLIVVIIYLSFRFEWKMAVSAIVALIHDLVITAGIYSLSGFEVSPSTVIALLTILGFSLYDTVVVFDKVRENTIGLAGGSRMTYSQAANLAVNQTLVRSINTSIIALLPVAGLLIIGAGLLGAGSLKDLALALLIGLAAGAYSSIFIATPMVADMKEREPTYKQLTRRVAARQTKEAAGGGKVAAKPSTGGQQTTPQATTTALLEDPDAGTPDDQTVVSRPATPGPRPGSRPNAQRKGGRGGRPGGRSNKRKRR
jgi:preprotein translocase subunit SecF